MRQRIGNVRFIQDFTGQYKGMDFSLTGILQLVSTQQVSGYLEDSLWGQGKQQISQETIIEIQMRDMGWLRLWYWPWVWMEVLIFKIHLFHKYLVASYVPGTIYIHPQNTLLNRTKCKPLMKLIFQWLPFAIKTNRSC